MSVYAEGYSLPDGEGVNYPGGWWTPEGRVGLFDRMTARQLQCPTLAMKPPTNPWWHEMTNYSYAIMGGRVGIDGQVTYSYNDYPVPDQMTHPATTVLLHDLGGSVQESGTNAWTWWSRNGGLSIFVLDPHDGKSNYLFCDGHVELLAFEALNETMWQSRWVPQPPTEP